MLRYILYVVSRSNGRIWTGCRFHSLSSLPQMQHLPSNLTIWKEKCPFPPQNTKHIWTRGTWRWPDQKRYRASHRYIWHDCATNALRKEPQNSSVTPEKPCHLRKTQKEHPLPHLLQVRSMYLHTPKSSTWFWLNRPRPQATSQTSTSRPFTMVLHSYHADSDSPIHDQELAETFRALHNNKDWE